MPVISKSVETNEGTARAGAAAALDLSAFENIFSSLHEFHWINWFAVKQYFVVDMGTRGPTGGTHQTDFFTKIHLLSSFDQYFMQMAITGAQAQAMVDLHHAAVGAFPADICDDAGRSSPHPRAPDARQIDTAVESLALGEGIATFAEAGRDGVAIHRRRNRQPIQHRVQGVKRFWKTTLIDLYRIVRADF